ncbi:MAG: M14 family zinc carboxypeptidase [Candidatus Coproplasma sp.]
MIYEEVEKFYSSYRRRKCVIGYSFQGRKIFAFHVGDDLGRQYISTYAIHGREWICARLALKHIKISTKVGGWIVPLVNPDGAIISQTCNPLWKANARGVDLNVNFDADWGSGRLNTRARGSENCIGDAPFSECESLALARFTVKVRPFVTLSFHTKGGEIYWEYEGAGDELGAKILSEATGYQYKRIVGSCGGYKDWCIQKLGIPSYTVECGSDDLTHPITRLKDIRECKGALKYFTENYEKQIYGERLKVRKKGV